ncbi:MFS transporter [Prosthecomicrobium sp. N25]|uniref:MFS transporter n=1 Tax=Prosthecomicrobium sp. N25 TaxID=3129254 RepID=UPI0030782C7A
MTIETLSATTPAARASTWAILAAQPALVVIMGTVAGHMMMMGMLAPVLSLYSKSFGVAEWAVGLIITAFGVGRLLMDLPAGLMAERYGRRLLVWLGPAIVGVASLGAALATDFWLLVGFRFVQGLGSGIYMTAASVVCADLAKPGQRGRIMALYQTAMLVGAGFGPVVGGYLAGHFGYAAPFWLSLAIGMGAALYAFLCFDETRRPNAGGSHHDHSFRAFVPIARNPVMAVALLVNFGTFLTRAAGQWQMLPLAAHERFGFDTSRIGLAITLMTVANLAVLPFTGRLIERHGTVACVVAATLATTAALVLAALGGQAWMFWVAMAGLGAATGLQGPAVATYAVDHAPGGRFGPAMGLMRFAGDVGFVAGPLLLGTAIDLTPIGYGGAILLNAGLMALSAGLFLAFGRRHPLPSPSD